MTTDLTCEVVTATSDTWANVVGFGFFLIAFLVLAILWLLLTVHLRKHGRMWLP